MRTIGLLLLAAGMGCSTSASTATTASAPTPSTQGEELALTAPTPGHLEAMRSIAEHAILGRDFLSMLLLAVPAGFFVAALVWMLPNARGFEIWVIVLPTYLIALGGFAHVVVGSMEVWLLVLTNQLSVIDGLWGFIVPALIGNILGGTVLFSLLAYGQVRLEIDD